MRRNGKYSVQRQLCNVVFQVFLGDLILLGDGIFSRSINLYIYARTQELHIVQGTWLIGPTFNKSIRSQIKFTRAWCLNYTTKYIVYRHTINNSQYLKETLSKRTLLITCCQLDRRRNQRHDFGWLGTLPLVMLRYVAISHVVVSRHDDQSLNVGERTGHSSLMHHMLTNSRISHDFVIENF